MDDTDALGALIECHQIYVIERKICSQHQTFMSS